MFLIPLRLASKAEPLIPRWINWTFTAPDDQKLTTPVTGTATPR
jgi:hypothetical protein